MYQQEWCLNGSGCNDVSIPVKLNYARILQYNTWSECSRNPDERKGGASAKVNCSLDEAEPSIQHFLTKRLGKLCLSFTLASAVERAKFGVTSHIVSASCNQKRKGTVGCVLPTCPFVSPRNYCWVWILSSFLRKELIVNNELA